MFIYANMKDDLGLKPTWAIRKTIEAIASASKQLQAGHAMFDAMTHASDLKAGVF